MGLLGGDCRVTVDQSGEDTSHGLNAHGQRGNIQQQNVLDITSEHGSLNGSTDSNGLVRVDRSVGLLAEEALDEFTNLGHTGGATDHKHLINLGLVEARVLEAVLKRLGSSVDVSLEETLQLCASKLQVQMLGSTLVEGQIGDAD